MKLCKTDKTHLKWVCINGSVVNGLRQPLIYSFVLDDSPGYHVFCQLETIHYKK